MNKNLPLLIGGLVIVGAVGAFLLLRPQSGGPVAKLDGDDKATVSASFAELIKLGQDYSCTFATTDDTGNSNNGTVYVAEQGTKMNGDFTMTQPNGTVTNTNIIRDGSYTYIWTSDQTQGYKMKIDPASDDVFAGKNDNEAGEQTAFDENESVDFDCQPWRPQASMFVPPSDIEFVDFSAQLEVLQEQTGETQPGDDNANCSLCNQTPAGEARTQCLAALGC